MKRERVLLLLAVVLALTPFLGLPYLWLQVLVPLLALALLAVSLGKRRIVVAHEEATPITTA